ncbi:MAG: rod-binding protein [Candidatus Hydrogenedentota bacterium]|mgnify:CR=1 FL=1
MLYINPIAERFGAQAGLMADSPARTKMALRELEHFFLYTMLREMRKTVPENGLFGKDSSMSIYQDMFDDAIAGHMADSGQFGLAKAIEEQLRVQELQQSVQTKGQ